MSTPPSSLWRNRDYLVLSAGQAISSLGTGISQIALPILIYLLTKNAALVGATFAVGQLPYVLFSLPAGTVADRWDRKRLMRWCTAGLALCLASIPLMLLIQPSQPLLLVLFLIISFIIGTLTIFYGIAELATITKLVPKAQISLALTQNEVVYSTVSLLAPALATFLLSINHPLPFTIDALSYLVLLVSLLYIRASFQEQRDESSRASHHILIDIRESLQWVSQRPIICLFIVLAGYLEVIVSVNVLLLPVIAQHAHFPLSFVGVILAAGGMGNLVGTALGPFLQRHVRLGWGLMGTLLLFVVLWPLYGFVTNTWLLGVLIAALSLIDSVAYLFTASYRLAVVPDSLQGRVGSIARLSLFSFLTIGPPLVGICLQRFGVGATVGVLWVGFLLFALLTLLYPRVRRATFPKE